MVGMERCLVRVFSGSGAVVGAGFLAAPRIALTCAHVVRAASGVVEAGAAVSVDFPFLKTSRLSAVVLRADAEKDIAVLRLEADLPADACPAPLVSAPEIRDHPSRAFGFMEGHPEGIWARGILRGPIGDVGWLQIDADPTSAYFVEPGFSGGPLWDDEVHGIVGMVVTKEKSPRIRAAFCIPTRQLVDFWPDLAECAVPPNPYRGLLAFREQDAPFFFGREVFADRLVEEVKRHPLTAVVGPSGSGKSSVVFAGLLPRLRPCAEWAIVACRPGREPFAELAAALLPLLEPTMTETDRLREIPKLADGLRSGEIPLDRLARRVLEKGGGERLLVVVDQWEELYTLCPEDDRRAFVEMWLQALFPAPPLLRSPASPLPRPSAPLHLLLTLRADFMGQALAHRPFADALNGRDFLLGPMNREELAQAVVCPAQKQGVRFEEGLVDRILDDVADEPGNLPLLEFALTQLWERQEGGRLTHRAYEDIGGVEEALVRYAEEVYAGLPEADREAARRVFIQLVHPGEGTEDTRRRATRAELGEARWALVQRLADARLVVTARDSAGQETAEVAHEALLQRWERLRAWMAEDRDFRLWQERTRAAYRAWEESGWDEGALLRGAPLAQAQEWLSRRGDEIEPAVREYIHRSWEHVEAERRARERLRRRITFGLAFGLVVTLLLAFFALIQRNQAITEANMRATAQAQSEERRREAEAARATAVAEAGIRATAQAQAEEQREAAQARQLASQAQYMWRLPRSKTEKLIAPLLAMEALRRAPSVEAHDILQEVLFTWPRRRVVRHEGSVRDVAFSPDGRFLATAGDDGTTALVEVATGREIARIRHAGSVRAVAFSPDGRFLATASWDGTTALVEAATGREIARIRHESWVEAIAFSPDGRFLATRSDDGTAALVEVATGREIARIRHEGSVWDVAFSPDGRFLATRSGDDIAALVEVATGREIARIRHEGSVWDVAFSPDGRFLATRSDDG
ncbi:MAG: trypsin-like peptidase domain-containing protein, partial [Anaerolineae bacterium]|nr:trypsin-like peptidase domain-containing protein [Anaerolineae bacterium]